MKFYHNCFSLLLSFQSGCGGAAGVGAAAGRVGVGGGPQRGLQRPQDREGEQDVPQQHRRRRRRGKPQAGQGGQVDGGRVSCYM